MLDSIFTSIIPSTGLTAFSLLICTAASVILGLGIAAAFMFKNTCSRSITVTLAIIPVIVQMVIILVNGNIGTGIAVMGAFSLVRFRSAAGTAREIGSIFLAMAVGLACGAGQIGIAVILAVVVSALNLFYSFIGFGERSKTTRNLRITIPESLDYSGLFDDLFAEYTKKHELVKVKTTNMGSLYQLQYTIDLKSPLREKEFLDKIRIRNGNLDIICGMVDSERSEAL